MSSDAKAINPGGAENFIGKRHTWLKLSEPSIEGLRQAFLDPDSRIRLAGARPELAYRYPAIRRLRVSGAVFVDDFDIALGMNLNSLIGGGGTGKSTIIEYLRIVLGQEDGIVGDAIHNLRRIRETIRTDTVIEVQVERDGSQWVIRSVGGAPGEVVGGEPVPNFPKFFPVRVFSQREIYAIAESSDARARLIDNLIRDELDDIDRQAADAITNVRALDARLAERPALESRIRDIRTEILDLSNKLESLERIEADLQAWRALIQEGEFLQTLTTTSDGLVAGIRGFVDGEEQSGFDAPADELPHSTQLTTLSEALNAAKETMETDVSTAADRFAAAVADAFAAHDIAALRALIVEADRTYAERRDELLAIGVDPDLVRSYQEDLGAKATQVEAAEARLAGLAVFAERRSVELERLKQLWVDQGALRTQTAHELKASVPLNRAGQPFVEVVVEPFADRKAFHRLADPLIRDRRRISDDDWNSFVEAILDGTPAGQSPSDTLAAWTRTLGEGTTPAGCPWRVDDRRAAVLIEWLDEAALRELALVRVPDRTSVRLFRPDGSMAGELEGGLSVGQKCTAILAVVLARDDVPVVIDQPEEEVDNEFTYRDLVPLIRRAKETRQVLVATHDPNIPVNGDAELIFALEASEGRGVIKQLNGVDCLGALDRIPVQLAVEDIMEGSEDAFRRRYEKYGF